MNVKADKDQSQFQPRFALYSSDRKVPPGFMSTFVWGSQVPSTTHIVLRATRRTLYFCTSIVKSKIQKQSWYREYTTYNCTRDEICRIVQRKNPILCWHQRKLVGWLAGWKVGLIVTYGLWVLLSHLVPTCRHRHSVSFPTDKNVILRFCSKEKQ